ncbi:MAG: hypothetical protein H6654_14945 [Ardenticatenaceae bacterium]|nr:hypothetical protein [Ardenticatenaceae bacterium]MCB8974853.1 hypothetical protein [Ardenticatenaceae bacterium]
MSELQREIQKTFLSLLPSWNQWRKSALYRRTEDFIQWLSLDVSNLKVAIRLNYSIQSLAVQFPAISLTIGNEIRDLENHEWWITPSNWQEQSEEITEYILRHIQPSPVKDLTEKAILEFLNNIENNHPSVLTAQGITYISLHDIPRGFAYLEKARNRYSEIPAPWAQTETNRLTEWLTSSPEQILDLLRKDAKKGIDILGIQ